MTPGGLFLGDITSEGTIMSKQTTLYAVRPALRSVWFGKSRGFFSAEFLCRLLLFPTNKTEENLEIYLFTL